MMLSDRDLRERLNADEPSKRLVITPLLDPEQIGPAGVDLRLGTRFKVDVRTREPVMDPSPTGRPIESFFNPTYRDIGSRFVLYPGQVVLASTFEYVKLPEDLFGILVTRSSWNRLGISLKSIVQPGYVGTLTLELTNQSSSAVAIYPGLRIVQLCLLQTTEEADKPYIARVAAKYAAMAGPEVSAVASDHEWDVIKGWNTAEVRGLDDMAKQLGDAI